MPSEEQLRQAIDQVFAQFDKDNSGTLDRTEVTALINEAMKHVQNPRAVSAQEVNGFLQAVDKNNDGKISKEELLAIFKKVLGI